MQARSNKQERSTKDDRRRDFIRKAGLVGVGAPLSVVLLNVAQKKARADLEGYQSGSRSSSLSEGIDDQSEDSGGIEAFSTSGESGQSGPNSKIIRPNQHDVGGKGGPGQ